MEVFVEGDDHRDRGGQGLVVVAFGQGRGKLGLGFRGFHEHEARRAAVGGGRAPLEQLVQRLQLAVVDRFIKEGVLGAGGTEQLIERSIVKDVGHEASGNKGNRSRIGYRGRATARSAKAGSVECRDSCNTQPD